MGLLRFACSNLLSSKVRSSLALLGLTVAIIGMVSLFSVVAGLHRMTDEAFGRLRGVIVLQPGAPIPLFSRLPSAWGSEIAEVEGVEILCPEVWQRANVIEGKMVISPPRFIFGVDIETWNRLDHALYRDDLIAGRFLEEQDRGTSRTVISRSIAEEFNLAVGDRFVTNGIELELIGIYDTKSPMIDLSLLLDISRVREMSGMGPESVSAYYVQPAAGRQDAVSEAIRERFRGRPVEMWLPSDLKLPGSGSNPVESLMQRLDGLLKRGRFEPVPEEAEPNGAGSGEPAQNGARNGPGREQPTFDERLRVDDSTAVDVRTAEEWGAQVSGMTKDLDYMMMVLTGVAVTIAVLGIVNTMLMSVSERIIEIGILKANGWSRRNVLTLIAGESGLLGLVGGCLGATIGWGVTQGINSVWSDRIQLYASPGLLLFSIGFATVLGLLSGLYPAVWAMRLMPMDAIRRG